MSHWTIVATDITDVERLKEAAKDLKIKITERDGRIYLGESNYLYLEKSGKKYKLHADWHYVHDNLKPEKITELTNRYNYRVMESEARKRGMFITDFERTKTGGYRCKVIQRHQTIIR